MNVLLAAVIALVTAVLTHLLENARERRAHLRLKRAEKLEPLHALLVDAELTVDQVGPGTHPENYEKIHREISERLNTFLSEMRKRRIWVDQEVCDLMEEAWDALKRAGYAAWDYTDMDAVGSSHDMQGAKRACREARLVLEAEIRRLLGVESLGSRLVRRLNRRVMLQRSLKQDAPPTASPSQDQAEQG